MRVNITDVIITLLLSFFFKEQKTHKTYYITQQTLINVMWQSRWEESLGENGDMYMCG